MHLELGYWDTAEEFLTSSFQNYHYFLVFDILR